MEREFQEWVRDNTERDSLILLSPNHIDERISLILNRGSADLRIVLAKKLSHHDPAVDQLLKQLNDTRTQEEKLEDILSAHPHVYVLASQYGHTDVENLDFLSERTNLQLIKVARLRLSMMSPNRAYSIYLFRVEVLK